MKIGIESSFYPERYGLESGIERMASQGYNCVDYQSFVNTNTYLFEVSNSEFEEILKMERTAYENGGIEIAQAHGPWRWPPQDFTAEDREERFAKMAKSIRGTAILGCKYFVIHPIMPFGDNADPDPDKLWEMNYEFMDRLCRVGKENNVTVCFENMPMLALSISTPEACLRFVKTMNTPWMKICLDTGHCAVFGKQPGESVRLIGKEYLATLHVHDNNGKGDFHWLPYTGVIDWEDFGKALGEIEFEGTFSLETGIKNELTGKEQEKAELELVKTAKKIIEYGKR